MSSTGFGYRGPPAIGVAQRQAMHRVGTRKALCIRLFTVPRGIPNVSAASRYGSPWYTTNMSTCLTLAGTNRMAQVGPFAVFMDVQLLAGVGSFGFPEAATRPSPVIAAGVPRRGTETDRFMPPVSP